MIKIPNVWIFTILLKGYSKGAFVGGLGNCVMREQEKKGGRRYVSGFCLFVCSLVYLLYFFFFKREMNFFFSKKEKGEKENVIIVYDARTW
jgi:hypothetical protein